ncbi:MAG TPA: hypothetical protein VHC22_12225 [Pirellulales bacterium]|nr:hypothetical protein [Pirellulales bacterium]
MLHVLDESRRRSDAAQKVPNEEQFATPLGGRRRRLPADDGSRLTIGDLADLGVRLALASEPTGESVGLVKIRILADRVSLAICVRDIDPKCRWFAARDRDEGIPVTRRTGEGIDHAAPSFIGVASSASDHG